MNFKIVTPPVKEPLSIDDAKEHLRVVAEGEDKLIDRLIRTARIYVEDYLCRSLITQTIEYYLNDFSQPEVYYGGNTYNYLLPRPPLQSIEYVKYYDTNNALQTFTDYTIDIVKEPGLIRFNTLPIIKSGIFNAIVIRYKAGYGDEPANVPDTIKQGILLTLAELYERRETAIVGAPIQPVVMSAEYLLSGMRVFY